MGSDNKAADWFARMHGPDAAAARPEFDSWYAEPTNAEAYDHLARAWDQAKFLANTPTGRARNLDLARPHGGRHRAIAFGAGAALAAALCAMVIGRLVYTGPRLEHPIGAIETISSADAGRVVMLADGSRVMVDRGSQLDIAITADARRLRLLAGRARFEVTHDLRRPFVVEAGEGSVIAHGTMFDVALGVRGVQVVLLRGSVEVRGRAATAGPVPVRHLHPGQKVVIAGGALTVPVAATARDVQWPQPMIEFEAAPLGEAVAAFNRTSDRPIRIEGPAAQQLRVTGAFRRDDADAFAASLAAAFGLDLRHDEQSLTLVARQPAASGKKTIG